MSKPQRSLRLSPKSDYARFTGNRGEIFYDPVNDTLRVCDSETIGGSTLATRSWVATQLPSVQGLASETYVNQTVAAIPQYLLKIAAEDSTVLAVGRDETLQVRGQGSITTSISTDSTGIQLVITGPQVSNTDIDINAQFGSAAVIPTERAVKSYADLLFNLQTQQLQNGTLDVTVNSLVFNQGVPIDEVTNDPTFVDNSTSSVPTEQAIRTYIDRRLGNDAEGSAVPVLEKIGPRYLTAGVLSGQVVSMHCERNSTGAIGQIMSFGNGSSAGKGLRMPAAGRLILATLAGTGINGTITVQAYLNGSANASYQLTATNGSAGDVGVTQNFSNNPLLFNAGDTLGWYQASLPTASSAFNVNFYVAFD